MCEAKMNTESSTSTSASTTFGEKSPVDMSDSDLESQTTRIWEWGVDETLWNPDRTRYAGYLPLPGASEPVDDWIKKCRVKTAEETKQHQRAVAAFNEYIAEKVKQRERAAAALRERVGEPPIFDFDMVEDWIDI